MFSLFSLPKLTKSVSQLMWVSPYVVYVDILLWMTVGLKFYTLLIGYPLVDKQVWESCESHRGKGEGTQRSEEVSFR